MTDFPPKTCEIDRLLRNPKMVEAAKAGNKTQQRRDGIYAYPGDTFRLGEVLLTVTAVKRERLVDMTEADARAEGYPSLGAYQEIILKMHPGMRWDEDRYVWVHSFERSA